MGSQTKDAGWANTRTQEGRRVTLWWEKGSKESFICTLIGLWLEAQAVTGHPVSPWLA